MRSKFKQELEKFKTQRKLLLILVFAFMAAIIWIGGNVFVSQQKVSIADDVKLLSRPLTPSLDVEVFERIRAKKSYTEDELNEFPIYKLEKEEGTGKFQIKTIQGDVVGKEEDEQDSIDNLIKNRKKQATSSAQNSEPGSAEEVGTAEPSNEAALDGSPEQGPSKDSVSSPGSPF